MMTSGAPVHSRDVTIRQAAVIAALSLVVIAVLSPVAFFNIFPRLIVRTNIDQTVQNITAHRGLFLAGLSCYLITFIADVVVAWSLMVFLRPVNTSLAALAGWFRLVYAALGLSGLLKLASAYRFFVSSDVAAVLGVGERNAQVYLLLTSFRYGWSFSMTVFAVHLLIVSYLVYKSGYVPKAIGILLAVNGAAYLVDAAQPYIGIVVPYLFVAFFGELIFMIWLLFKGGRTLTAAPP